MNPFTDANACPAEAIDFDADLATSNVIRLEVARSVRRRNEIDTAREKAAADNAKARRRGDDNGPEAA